MKKSILLLALLPTMLTAQYTDSWVQFVVQYDFYAPSESNFFMVEDTLSGDTVMFHAPTDPYEVLDTIIFLNSGDYVVTLTDSYGDGWISQAPAWFKMQNTCQGLILNYDPLTMAFFTLDTLVNIWPCAPPISGCTNPIALNYDSLAFSDDGSCLFIEGCMNPNASNYDSTAGQLPNGLIVAGGSCNDSIWDQNYFGVDSADYWSDPSIFAIGNRLYIGFAGQQWFVDAVNVSPYNCNAPAVLIYVVPMQSMADGDAATFAPGTDVNAIVGEPWKMDPCIYIYGCTDPNALNYDPNAGVNNGTCINIPGCTDSTAGNYNPAATQDDGSCGGGGNITCSPGKTLLTVEIMFDQYAAEIGWNIYTTAGVLIHDAPQGQFNGVGTGQIVTKQLCIDDGTEIQFTITDSYGDGLGGAQFGGIDGTWIVYTDCDTISQGIGDFGLTFSEIGTVNQCIVADVFGCTDPAYQEYNSLANIDDGSCITFNIYGCIDPLAFNYDSTATAQYNNPSCDNLLTLTDWADNGWAGSFLVVTQGNTFWGPFTLQSNELRLDTLLPLNTTEEVHTYFYSFNQSQGTKDQCMFQITNPYGLVIQEGGTNVFTDQINVYNSPFDNGYYSSYPDCDDNCVDRIYACIDSLAVNYVDTANTDDGSCYFNPGCTDEAYLEYHTQGFVADYDDGSYCLNYANFGCMDSTAFNYNSLATVNWTSVLDQTDPCIAKVFGCTDPTAFNFDALANTEDYSCIPFIYGCMDNTQWNYDPNANTDNGSCLPYIFGCTDSTALNYDALANTDNGSCIPFLYGCTDSLALNYNLLANTDDGSCISIILGCIDASAFNYDPSANTDDGSCVPFIYGCLDNTQFNYNPSANTDNGSCIPFIYGCMDATQFNYDNTVNTDNGSCIPFIYGCLDSLAFNFNPLANTDNGSCTPIILGCTDTLAINYNPLANTEDGSCLGIIYGCTSPIAFNYDPTANSDDGSCIPFIYGCMDNTQFNFNSLANTDDGLCIPIINGCIDNSQWNYNPLANTDNGSCIPFIYGCTDSFAFNYDPLANTDNFSCIVVIMGCTDSTAINFDPLANTSDGSCIAELLGCTDPLALNYNPLANTDDGSCIVIIEGCMDPLAFNYNPSANVDNGSCVPFIYGCTDPTQFNYDATANTDDGNCIPYVYGCMDILSFNYNPLANTDNGSCIAIILGCMDTTALNYDILANTEYIPSNCILPISGCTDVSAYNYDPVANTTDSTACLYEAVGCVTGLGAPFGTGYWLNDGCFAWVIDVDDYCCTTDWDASCQSMYDYCQLGWPTAIQDISALGIIVYPNPTKDVITIETRLDIQVELYDMTGKRVINESNIKRLDLSKLPSGIYNMSILYKDSRYSKRVIKQ
jgi:hypothetical protein